MVQVNNDISYDFVGLSEPTEGHITYNGKKLDKTMYNRIGYLPKVRFTWEIDS